MTTCSISKRSWISGFGGVARVLQSYCRHLIPLAPHFLHFNAFCPLTSRLSSVNSFPQKVVLAGVALRQSKENIEIVPQETCVQHKGNQYISIFYPQMNSTLQVLKRCSRSDNLAIPRSWTPFKMLDGAVTFTGFCRNETRSGFLWSDVNSLYFSQINSLLPMRRIRWEVSRVPMSSVLCSETTQVTFLGAKHAPSAKDMYHPGDCKAQLFWMLFD